MERAMFGLLLCVLSSAPCAAYRPLPDLNTADILFEGGVKPSRPGGAEGPKSGVTLTGYVSAWSQDCSGELCAPPAPLVTNRPVSLEFSLPQSPGQAAPRVVKENFSLEGAGELALALSFYAVCPSPAVTSGAQSPSKSAAQCPALYFQVQADLTGAAESFCAAALNEKDFAPFPVLMCGGAKKAGKRLGVTLHRNKF